MLDILSSGREAAAMIPDCLETAVIQGKTVLPDLAGPISVPHARVPLRPDAVGLPVELIDRIFKEGLGEFDLVLAPTYGGIRYDLARGDSASSRCEFSRLT
jgi:hypothetical protein